MKVHGNTRHGYAKRGGQTPTYKRWLSMRRRCDSPSQDSWRLYGGRGIAVCDRWQIFENFLVDMGVQPAGCSLDRINPDGNYEPGNCRWIPHKLQGRNKRNNHPIEFRGRTMCISAWAEEIGMKPKTLRARLFDYNWPIERALTEPLAVSEARAVTRLCQ